jgi:hypothetical protein
MLRGAFNSWQDQTSDRGVSPVVFDILAPDKRTSLLPPDLRLVLQVNPKTMQKTEQKIITRIQTMGGWVEQHWGRGPMELSFEMATGGFVRLYTGLSAKTGDGLSNAPGARQGRRETLAYEHYLDILALFHNNGAIYDQTGALVAQGYLQITFDEGVFLGWFDGDFSVTEEAGNPFSFNLSTRFTIEEEVLRLRGLPLAGG